MKSRAALFACLAVLAAAMAVSAEPLSERDLMPVDLDAPLKQEPWYWRDWKPPSAVDVGMLLAAEATILIDTLQTRDLLRRRSEGFWEANPLLGSNPSDGRLFATTGAVMLLTAAGWYLFPSPWRQVLSGGILAFEVPNVARSASLGARIHF